MIEWRPIPGYPDYEASSEGDIRSLPRRHRLTGGPIGGRVLKQHVRADNGRPQVEVWRDGKRRVARVHVLVCEAFHGPRPDGLQVCHEDDMPTNNRADNLRWDTGSANQQDMIRAGRHWQKSKTHCPRDHPYDEENTRVRRDGSRACLACEKARNDARYARAS